MYEMCVRRVGVPSDEDRRLLMTSLTCPYIYTQSQRHAVDYCRKSLVHHYCDQVQFIQEAKKRLLKAGNCSLISNSATRLYSRSILALISLEV